MARHQNHGLRKVCDCPRRNWPKCRHPWHFNFRWRGQIHRLSLAKHVDTPIATKADAKSAAERLRIAIRNGTFQAAPPAPAATPGEIMLKAYGPKFLEGFSQGRGKVSWQNDASMIRKAVAFLLSDGVALGDKSIGAITEDDLEAFLQALRAAGKAASTRNQYLQLFRSMSAWGQRKGYLARPWLTDLSDLRREKHAKRNRRLVADKVDESGKVTEPGEERRLLAAAGPRLARLLVGALETGARQGELLSLQWADVDLERREIRLRAEKTKDREDRWIPISVRLHGFLELGRHDPAGEELPATAYVFGDALGGRLASVKKAWTTACRKAQIADLHFHDLRHEAGSRMLEGGVPLHHVKEILGHASIATTDTYLNATRLGLHDSMRRLDERRSVCKEDANTPPQEPPPDRKSPEAVGDKRLVN